MHYYRIRQTTRDGLSFISSVVAVLKKKGAGPVMMAPNPTRGLSYIIQPAEAFLRGYTIFDAAGRVIRSQQINAKLNNVWQLDVSTLTQGVYRLVLDYNEKKDVLSFIKN
jgi:hypothetical protein